MRKCVTVWAILGLLSGTSVLGVAQVQPSRLLVPVAQPAQLAAQQQPLQTATSMQQPVPASTAGTVSKGSLVSARVDSKLNEKILHSTSMDYSLPPELAETAKKCLAADSAECYFSFKSYETASDPKLAAAANLELAVLSLQRGMVKQAIKHIDKAAALSPEDPFIELTRGWVLLSAGKYKKARSAFSDLFYLTAEFEYVSSAKLGTALAYYYEGDKELAATELQYLYTSDPYLISFVSYLLGEISATHKKYRNMAPIFLQQSLIHDGGNYSAAELLAKLAAKSDNKLQAWQYYATLFAQDPQNKQIAKKIEKYSKNFGDKSIDYLFYLRLEQPIAQEMLSTPSPIVKMALYADRNQTPVELQSLAVMPSGTMTVSDDKLGQVLKSGSYNEKKLVFNPENGGVDLQDGKGHVEFSTRRPFTISLDNPTKTLLVKNLRAHNIFAADFSDKELKGTLTVSPTKTGILLINNVYSEDLIPALLATQAQDIKNPAAQKALAVVFRSALRDAVAKNDGQLYHITDNDEYFKFKGINLVFRSLLASSKDSGDIELAGTNLGYYANCGVLAYDGIQNTAQKPAYVFSPANVSKYLLSNPPSDLYSKPSDPTMWSAIKWMYAYNGKEIAARVGYTQNIGKLRALIPLERTPSGRILSMRFEGSKGSYTATTPKEISFLLSAGTMRSNLFDIIPVYDGKYIKQILVRGYDTGTGIGLCLQGADGLAKQGADYQSIIKYYFPEARILNKKTGMIH